MYVERCAPNSNPAHRRPTLYPRTHDGFEYNPLSHPFRYRPQALLTDYPVPHRVERRAEVDTVPFDPR